MDVRYRVMKPNDFRTCVEGIATHPVLGPRYGNLIEQLPAALSSILGQDSVTALVFEEFEGSSKRFVSAGLAAFVSDDFLQEIKTTPLFWIGPELVKRITHGNSPLLSDANVRDANSTVGLNLAVWHDTAHPKDMVRAEILTPVMNAFDESFRGFRLREIIAPADCLEHLHVMRNAGGLYFQRNENRYGSFPEVTAQEFECEPRYVGMSRELAFVHGASWVGSLFLYPPPQFCFSRSERRQLTLALEGGTDMELGDELGISEFGVKKTWRVIYDRVAACQPEVIPNNEQADASIQDRGKQKKQRLLAYLRKHPEELRPVSRKLLQQEGAQRRPSAEAGMMD
jgi:hypothetical protein